MRGEALLRWILPALLVSLLVFAWVRFAVPRTVHGVRVFGGLLTGGAHASLRIEAWRDDGFTLAPVPEDALAVELFRSVPPGSTEGAESGNVLRHALPPDAALLAAWSGRTDAQGMAWIEADLRPPSDGSEPLVLELARGGVRTRLRLSPPAGASWPKVERANELPGTASGRLGLRVLPELTTFAVPFPQRVTVRVTLDSEPILALVTASLEGRGRIDRVVPGVVAARDATGDAEPTRPAPDYTASFEIEPGEHTVALRVEATATSANAAATSSAAASSTAASEPLRGTWYGRLPIVPGALWVRRVNESTLRVDSPIRLERAYLALVDEERRHFGMAVPLTDDARGGATATVTLPFALGSGPLWAVVSSEPRLDSDAALGWPISESWVRPAPVRRAPELLLADSLEAERAGERARQRSVQRRLFVAAVLCGGFLSAWLVRAVRGSRRRLAAPLSAEAASPLVEDQRPRLTLFVVLLISSFVLLGIWLWTYWRPV